MVEISIITAVLNGEKTLSDCLTCISQQKDIKVQHIIVDGGSTDYSLTIVNHYPHIQTVVIKDKISLYEALNMGIKRANGEVIGMLHCDDIFTSRHTLNTVIQCFKDQSIDAVYGDLVVVERGNKSKVIRRWKAGEFRYDSLRLGWMPPHPTLFIRKSIFQKYGLYKTNFSISSDYELIVRFLYCHKISIKYLRYPLVIMRNGGLSNQTIKNRWLANKEDLKAWKLNNLPCPTLLRIFKPLRKLSQFYPSLF
ncbi:MAG: glycosyltransferase family 2 protein [Saprospiraceae bacterium]|jgi:glycosyltransferase